MQVPTYSHLHNVNEVISGRAAVKRTQSTYHDRLWDELDGTGLEPVQGGAERFRPVARVPIEPTRLANDS